MSHPIELKAGDPCPTCGGALEIDERFAPAAAIDRHRRNADKPESAARFAEHVQAKADEVGLMHTCRRCGYQARLVGRKSKKDAA